MIEIGAVMINEFGEELGSYNRFIKPHVNPLLSGFCKSLTSIRQEDVDRAQKYDVVIEEFKNWINVYEEEYLLCSWGQFDKVILQENGVLHKLENDWLEHHINVKKQYAVLKDFPKQTGLKNTIVREGFEFTGIHHRAIADAENLVKIFTKYIDEWIY